MSKHLILYFSDLLEFLRNPLSGARAALPMVVAPEPMVGCLQASIGSNNANSKSSELALEFLADDSNFIETAPIVFDFPPADLMKLGWNFPSGARAALPMAVAPESILGCLQASVDSSPRAYSSGDDTSSLLIASLLSPLLTASLMTSYGKILRLLRDRT